MYLLQSLYREGKKLKEKVVDLRDAQEDLRQQMDSRKGKQRELKSQQDELKRGKCSIDITNTPVVVCQDGRAV